MNPRLVPFLPSKEPSTYSCRSSLLSCASQSHGQLWRIHLLRRWSSSTCWWPPSRWLVSVILFGEDSNCWKQLMLQQQRWMRSRSNVDVRKPTISILSSEGNFMVYELSSEANLNICSRLRSNASMRPCDLFDLRLSTLASLGSLLLTYVIVLGQFRAGEYSQSLCKMSVNSTSELGNNTGFSEVIWFNVLCMKMMMRIDPYTYLGWNLHFDAHRLIELMHFTLACHFALWRWCNSWCARSTHLAQ